MAVVLQVTINVLSREYVQYMNVRMGVPAPIRRETRSGNGRRSSQDELCR